MMIAKWLLLSLALIPVKASASADASNGTSVRRFLVVTMPGDPPQLVLR
jgi:hypothetical protein